jgi:exopolysaccharide biosynthesis polyprenyl glycosylphosphotransferase
MKRSELFFTSLLVPLDALMLLVAFAAAYYLRDQVVLVSPELIGGLSERIQYFPDSDIQPFNEYLRYVLYLVPGMIGIFALTGLYSVRPSTRFWQRLGKVTLGVSIGLFFILLLFLFQRDFFLPRTTVLYSWVLGIIFVMWGRWIVRLFQRGLYGFGIGAVRVAVLGSPELAGQLVKQLTRLNNAQYMNVPAPAGLTADEIVPQISRDQMDELVIFNEKFSIDDLIRIRNKCLEEHVGFGFVPRAFTALQGAAYAIRDEVGLPVIEVRPTPLEGWGRIYKRGFDVVMSALLILFFLPLYVLIIGALIMTGQGTPLTFKHKRIGRGGSRIKVTKFRSMKKGWGDENGKLSAKFRTYLEKHPEAAKEWEQTAKLKDDPRISGVGKFLRATRLDELPQFFDVLRGDLSLVGPRPIVDWELEKFGEKARILFHVRPGITGPWQVEGGNSLPYEERVRLNAHYIENWSPWLDLLILFKTGLMMIVGIAAGLLGKKERSDAY